jgi:hypothetical protein
VHRRSVLTAIALLDPSVHQQRTTWLRDLLLAAIPKTGPQPQDVCATAVKAGADLGSRRMAGHNR